MGNKRKGIEFDHMTFAFKNATVNTWHFIKAVLVYVLGTLTVAVLLFVAASLIFSTDAEKRMHKEIRMYKEVFSELEPKADLLEDAVASLQYKDDDLYNQIFHSHAPAVDPLGASRIVYASDTIPDSRILGYAGEKAEALAAKADSVETAFKKVMTMLSDQSVSIPPMSLPVSEISYSQVGASTGRKINPFLKAYVFHGGLDLMVPRGTPVLASADGKVTAASTGGSIGKAVRIEHEGGYETEYQHLETISVKKGQNVKRGDKIGTVGMSGKAYAPHLHYAILKDGVSLNPVHYVFASVSPEEYANMLYMSVNTLQSMD